MLFCLGNFNHNLLFADLVIFIATNCDLLVIIMLVVIETKWWGKYCFQIKCLSDLFEEATGESNAMNV